MKLTPLADPVFKKIFGEYANLLIDLINALLDLKHPVVSIEYLQTELVPELILEKNTIVDVRCTDSMKRNFIVEMQITHVPNFYERVLLNAAKVYSSQLKKGDNFKDIQPVYAINIIDDITERESEGWIHHYSLRHQTLQNRSLDGITLIFLELAKCRKRVNFNMNDPRDRWIKYFIEPEYFFTMDKLELEKIPNLKQAVELLDTSHYTPEQLRGYDQYLDSIRVHNAFVMAKWEEGKQAGFELVLQIMDDVKAKNLSIAEIAEKYNLDEGFVEKLV